MNDIKVQNINGELYADSRRVAEVLGVGHQSLREMIVSHSGSLGTIRFETGASEMPDGRINPKPEKYILLTERQALIVLTLVRNTEQAVAAKVALVDAFQSMRKKLTEAPTGTNLLALAVLEAQKMLEAKDQQIALMKPKAEFFDTVAGSKSAVHLGDVAKNLDIPGMGRNNLFLFLRTHGVLMADNMPYQEHVDAQRFRVIQQSHTNPRTLAPVVDYTTLVYPKGVKFILDMLKREGYSPRGMAS